MFWRLRIVCISYPYSRGIAADKFIIDQKALDTKDFRMPDAPYVIPSFFSEQFSKRFFGFRFYEDLGTVEDMSASLIVDAYHRQCLVDPSRGPLYLKCLKAIGTLRGGTDWEVIDQTVQVAYSEGKYTRDDVEEAYNYIGLWHDDPNLTEDSIIKRFHVLLSYTTEETELRKQVWRVGQSRGSERIKAASEDREITRFLLVLGTC